MLLHFQKHPFYHGTLEITPNQKISPSTIFQDAHNISPTPKINGCPFLKAIII